jgi:hypothetical protein
VNDRPHLAYPSRRTLAWRAVKVIAGPSTTGSSFALWEAGGANCFGCSEVVLPGRRIGSRRRRCLAQNGDPVQSFSSIRIS